MKKKQTTTEESSAVFWMYWRFLLWFRDGLCSRSMWCWPFHVRRTHQSQSLQSKSHYFVDFVHFIVMDAIGANKIKTVKHIGLARNLVRFFSSHVWINTIKCIGTGPSALFITSSSVEQTRNWKLLAMIFVSESTTNKKNQTKFLSAYALLFQC